jgi:hypothetical protein
MSLERKHIWELDGKEVVLNGLCFECLILLLRKDVSSIPAQIVAQELQDHWRREQAMGLTL